MFPEEFTAGEELRVLVEHFGAYVDHIVRPGKFGRYEVLRSVDVSLHGLSECDGTLENIVDHLAVAVVRESCVHTDVERIARIIDRTVEPAAAHGDAVEAGGLLVVGVVSADSLIEEERLVLDLVGDTEFAAHAESHRAARA